MNKKTINLTKLNKRDYINFVILISFYLIIVMILTRFKYIYGSTLDWQGQHWAFPEYFRNLFYANHDIFPSFAFNIGGGQNIYNFSYYGLFSPIIIISYLFPFVRMIDYIVITSILAVISSTVLFYIWLKQNGYNSNICFLISFIFLCSGPLIFQSHRQIMFMNYMPFLVLGLIGIDNYFNNKKPLLLIISTFLMIMTSYFFSVGGIIVLFICGIYKYIKTESELKFKTFFWKMVRLAVPILTGVFMSGVLLLPTLFSLLNGRSDVIDGKSLDILSLLLPQIKLVNILYNPYSLGLSSVAIIAIISGFLSKKKERIFLSAIISSIIIFPVFLYALNGTLYINPKVLIPFLPLVCLITADFIGNLLINKCNKQNIIITFATLTLISIFAEKWHSNLNFIIDFIIIGIAIIFFCKTGKKLLIYVFIILICSVNCINVNIKDSLYLSSQAQVEFSGETESLIETVSNTDNNFYRFSNELYPLTNVNKVYSADYYQTTLYSSIYNKDYNNFYFNVFNNEVNFRNSVITNPTKNSLFNIYMGNKYIITDQLPPIGYQLLDTKGAVSIYKNDSVFTLGYATDKLMSETSFDKLEYPYTVEALLNYGIVSEKYNDNFTTNIKPFSLDIASMDYNKLEFQKKNDTYLVKADDNANMTLKLIEPVNNKVLFIRFHMELQDNKNDTCIIINDVKNTLTCKEWKYQNNNYIFDYVLSSNEPIEKLDISFKKGDYQISNIEVYTLDYERVKSINTNIDPFKVDMKKTSGDFISGKINVTKDGYFILNIPYDKGFTIEVDGKEVNYEKVNKSFIGFKIAKGEKIIDINYQAPFQKQGIVISFFGVVMAVAIFLLENVKRNCNNDIISTD